MNGHTPAGQMIRGLPGSVDELLTPAGRRLLEHPTGAFARALAVADSVCDWHPQAPTRLFYAEDDEQAVPGNTRACHAAFAEHGVLRAGAQPRPGRCARLAPPRQQRHRYAGGGPLVRSARLSVGRARGVYAQVARVLHCPHTRPTPDGGTMADEALGDDDMTTTPAEGTPDAGGDADGTDGADGPTRRRTRHRPARQQRLGRHRRRRLRRHRRRRRRRHRRRRDGHHRRGRLLTVSSSALDQLTGDAQTFREKVWASRVHHHQVDPAELAAYFSLEDADRLLTATAIRTPSVRLVRDGTVLPEKGYTRGATLAGRPLTGLVDGRTAVEEFRNGSTVVFQGLHRSFPPLVDLISRLELELGHPCQANAYLTPPGPRGSRCTPTPTTCSCCRPPAPSSGSCQPARQATRSRCSSPAT